MTKHSALLKTVKTLTNTAIANHVKEKTTSMISKWTLDVEVMVIPIRYTKT